METYLALDLGGTKLLIGEVDRNGSILRAQRYPTDYRTQRETADGLLAHLAHYKKEIGFAGTPIAAGIGLVGMSDHVRGLWRSLGHIPQEDIPLAAMLEEALGIPAAVDNDVRSAATAELLLGTGKTSRDFIYINVGTGLAAGFVIDGKILRGAHNIAGEVGHSVSDRKSENRCGCGRFGCTESEISGIGFTRQVQRLHSSYPGTRLPLPGEGEKANTRQLFQLAREGDDLCAQITAQSIEALSALVLNLVRVTDPDTVVFGGGVIADDWFFAHVKERLAVYSIMRNVTGGVLRSAFGADRIGLVGAAALAMIKAEETSKHVAV